MNDQAINKITTAIGISATAIGVIVLVGMGMTAYRNYYEIVRAKLQIKELRRNLGEKSVD